MKKYVLAALATTALASGADAASFNFSFVNNGFGSTDVVAGVLDGLVEGSNDVTGLSATVTSGLGVVPDGYVFALGTGTSGTFTVTAGSITFANAYFLEPNSGRYLFLGTDPFGSTYYPQLFDGQTGGNAYSRTAPTFSAVSVAAVPEPATWAMLIVGFGMIGAAARHRRHRTTLAYA